MVHTRYLVRFLALFTLWCHFVPRAHADTISVNGVFSGDDSYYRYSFTTTSAQNYTFTTTSFAKGGFVPVLTLFSSTGGVPLAFAETDNSDVSIDRVLGPGSYFLYFTEDPNVFTSTLAAGLLYPGSPNATGDICGVSGGKFLNVFDGCSQRTNNFALTINSTAATVTPEPATWLLVLPPLAFLCVFQLRRQVF